VPKAEWNKTIKWPVLDLGYQPNILPKDWTMTVAGHVTNPIKWKWNDSMAQPQETVTSDNHCVTAWPRFANLWQGVSGRHFLDVVKPTPTVKFLIFHGYDRYKTNVPIEQFAATDTMLAHSWNGNLLPREHGGPVRVVIPQLYFWKSAKWLKYTF
jgi:DMSO/TMAO reductase YedYZ molybdopterin-dependent catalytic subunit